MSIQTLNLDRFRHHLVRNGSTAILSWISGIADFQAPKNNSRSILALNVQALSLFRIIFSIYLAADFFLYVYPWYDDLYGNTGMSSLSSASLTR
jgi:hypothetical protein